MPETELTQTVRRISKHYKETGEVTNGVADATKNLKPLVGKTNAEARGSKLISAGIAIIALPEPTLITDAAGSILVVAGLIDNRMKPTTTADVNREIQREIKELRSIIRELTF